MPYLRLGMHHLWPILTPLPEWVANEKSTHPWSRLAPRRGDLSIADNCPCALQDHGEIVVIPPPYQETHFLGHIFG